MPIRRTYTDAQRLARYDSNAAQALMFARDHEEKGQREKAEYYHQLSARHLIRANMVRERMKGNSS